MAKEQELRKRNKGEKEEGRDSAVFEDEPLIETKNEDIPTKKGRGICGLTFCEWLIVLCVTLFIALHFTSPPEFKKFTREELKNLRFDDSLEYPTLALSVYGYIFNVTAGTEFYEEDAQYEQFVGHDCTRAFALSSLDVEDLDQDLDDLDEAQMSRVETSYRETYLRKYPIIGELIELPYHVSLRPERLSTDYSYLGSHGEEMNKGVEGKCPFTKKVKEVKDAFGRLMPFLLGPR